MIRYSFYQRGFIMKIDKLISGLIANTQDYLKFPRFFELITYESALYNCRDHRPYNKRPLKKRMVEF